ncbi:hypothetical protein BSKO_12719 [Bryopsis sp. KO-2023]|nr:hypothetical protein BSKO_12719 [Bryopsis sp. KO-2023]
MLCRSSNNGVKLLARAVLDRMDDIPVHCVDLSPVLLLATSGVDRSVLCEFQIPCIVDEDEVFDQIRAWPGVNLSRNDVAVPHGVFCPPETSLPCVEQVSSTPPPPCRDPRIRVAPEATGSTAETPRDSNKHKQSDLGLKRYWSKTLAQCLPGNEEVGAKESVHSTGSQAIACSHDTLCFVYLRQEALYRIMRLEKIIKSFGWDLKLAGLILNGAVVVASRTDG